MDMDTLTAFFGWCSLIHIGLMVLTAMGVLLLRSFILKVHGKMFGLSEETLSTLYFQYLAIYKIAIIVFALVPYVALKLMA